MDIMDAARYGDLDRLKQLVESKTDIELIDIALIYACEYSQSMTIVKYLVENNANIHVCYEMPWACEKGNMEIVKYLISMDANYRIKDDAILQCSAECGQYDVVKYLLDCNANISANNNGTLKAAIKKTSYEIVKLLINRIDYELDEELMDDAYKIINEHRGKNIKCSKIKS